MIFVQLTQKPAGGIGCEEGTGGRINALDNGNIQSLTKRIKMSRVDILISNINP